jgi:hypothetical protein
VYTEFFIDIQGGTDVCFLLSGAKSAADWLATERPWPEIGMPRKRVSGDLILFLWLLYNIHNVKPFLNLSTHI